MTKLAECFCFNLTDTLTGDIELFSDLFQCTVLFRHSIPKRKRENLLLSLCQCTQALHPAVLSDSVCAAASAGTGTLSSWMKVAQMAVFLLTDRSLKRNRFLGNLLRSHAHALPACPSAAAISSGVWFSCQAPAVTDAGYTDQLVDRLYHMNRYTDGSRLICNRTCDCLTDPPCCIGTELISLSDNQTFLPP